MAPGSGYFDRAFDMLLTMDLCKIIVDFTGNEIRLAGNWLQRCFAAQEIDDFS